MIAGITGHQNLGDALEWVRHALRHEVTQRVITRGLTSLAVGADQLFAEVLATTGIAYEAIIPCQKYEEAFTDDAARDRLHHLLAKSARVKRLPYERPSEEAFLAAGQCIVMRCELLFAVWDGWPARGTGGTGDIIAFAKARRRRWVHINPVERSVREQPC